MDNRQLQQFLCLCEEKNFSKAARRCFITQQGLSFAIKQLENELGVPLFDRKAHGIDLTEFGAALRTAAVAYTSQHDTIIDMIRGIKEKASAVISLGMAIGFSTLLPPRFFKDFLENHPNIMLNLRTFHENICQHGMLEHKLHTGFVSGPIDTSLFDAFLYKHFKMMLVARKDHPLAGSGTVKLSGLKGKKIIAFNNEMYPQNVLTKICLQSGIIPSIFLDGSEVNLLYELCNATDAIAFWGGPMEHTGDLANIEIEGLELYWDVYFIVQKNTYLSDAEKAFIAYTKKTLLKIDDAPSL
jgi:DNA-binding transcriptional LysR family regulator